MVRIKLKHLVEDVDRHGNVRRYVRLPGRKKVRIREAIGTPEFMAAYGHAVASGDEKPRQARDAARGSFRALCVSYFGSSAFNHLDQSTKNWRRHHLDEIARAHGDKPVALMQSKHVRRLRDELQKNPVVANLRLKALRALFSWAVEEEQASHNPTISVRPIKHISKGFHSWEMSEIEKYETRHPVGTKARLAMGLLLYTACRREDVVRLGPQHIRDGRLRYRQAKNEHRSPVDLDIPVHPDLRTIVEATPTNHLTFLTTAYGRAFTPSGFGNKFREWCNEAELPHCSAHGLRKAAAARLAERGATAHEIMAITGHRSLEEVERYTRAARQGKLADAAIAKLKPRTDLVPPD
jgi:integrase/recombinase XerD